MLLFFSIKEKKPQARNSQIIIKKNGEGKFDRNVKRFPLSGCLIYVFCCFYAAPSLPLQQEGIFHSLLMRLAGWLSVTFLLTSQHQALLPFLLFQPPHSFTKAFLSAWSESVLRDSLSCVHSLQYFIDYLCFVNILFILPIML